VKWKKHKKDNEKVRWPWELSGPAVVGICHCARNVENDLCRLSPISSNGKGRAEAFQFPKPFLSPFSGLKKDFRVRGGKPRASSKFLAYY
jgi:hypothetical protein